MGEYVGWGQQIGEKIIQTLGTKGGNETTGFSMTRVVEKNEDPRRTRCEVVGMALAFLQYGGREESE